MNDDNAIIQRLLERLNDDLSRQQGNTVDELKRVSAILERSAKKVEKDSQTQNEIRNILSRNKTDDRNRNLSGGQTQWKTKDLEKATSVLSTKSMGAATALGAFAGSLDSSAESLADFASSLPLVGGIITTVIGGVLINTVRGASDAFRTAAKSAIMAGSSMFEFNTLAAKAGMSVSDFSQMLKENAVTFNKYGVDNIVATAQAMRDASIEFRQMGATTGDITQILVSYLNQQKSMGKEEEALAKINQKDEQQRLAKLLQDTAAMTGESIDELAKKLAEQPKDPLVSAALATVQDPATRARLEKIMLQFGDSVPEMNQMLSNFVNGRDVLANTEAGKLGGALLPGFREAMQNLMNGAISTQDFLAEFQEISKNPEFQKVLSLQVNAGNSAASALQNMIVQMNNLSAKSFELTEAQEKQRERMAAFGKFMEDLRLAVLLPFYEGLESVVGLIDNPEFKEGIGQFAKLMGEGVGKTLKWLADNPSVIPDAIGSVVSSLHSFAEFLSGDSAVTAIGLTAAGLAGLYIGIKKTIVSGLTALFAGGSIAKGVGAAGLAAGRITAVGAGVTGAIDMSGAAYDIYNDQADSADYGSIAGGLIGGGIGALGGPIGIAIGMSIGSALGRIVGGYVDEHYNGEKTTAEIKKNLEDETRKVNDNIETLKEEQKKLLNAQDEASTARLKEIEVQLKFLENHKALLNKSKNEIESLELKQNDIAKKYESGEISRKDFAKQSTETSIKLKQASDLVDIATSGDDEEANRKIKEDLKKYQEGVLRRFHQFGVAFPTTDNMNALADKVKQSPTKDSMLALLEAMFSELGPNLSGRDQSMLNTLNGLDSKIYNRKFRTGGIADKPSIFGDGNNPEAAIPLTSGRQIPIAKIDMPAINKLKEASEFTNRKLDALLEAIQLLNANLSQIASKEDNRELRNHNDTINTLIQLGQIINEGNKNNKRASLGGDMVSAARPVLNSNSGAN